MSHPDADTLAGLALGEPVDPDVRRHVDACAECTAELVALSETRDLLRGPRPELVAPPPGLRAGVLAALDEEVRVESPGTVATPAAVPGVVRRRPFGAAWLAGAAAAGVLVGGLGVGALTRDDPVPDAQVLASARLDTLDTATPVGTADLAEQGGATGLTVRADDLTPGDGYLEVWLINRDLTRMVSIGVLEPSGSAQTFPVPAELLDQGYVIVDVSREPFDEDSTHSGDSLMRGTLPV